MDPMRNQFGLDRMLDALNENAGAAPEEILHGVRQAVSAFVKDAEQFDDITMLCLEYKGSRTANTIPTRIRERISPARRCK